MERLTKRCANGLVTLTTPISGCIENFLTCHNAPLSAAICKLAEYEDAEEAGTLVRLPCKAGDTVYVYGCGGVEEWRIQGISLSYITAGEIRSCPFNILKNSLGKTVFLTREEAEAALKARDGE